MTASRRDLKVPCLAMTGALLLSAVLSAQTVPPPGVAAARPPTERTLQPVDRTQTQERVRTSRDCRKDEADIKAQFRIQADSVRTQYEGRIAAQTGASRETLVKERDAKLASLHGESDAAAKKLGDACREGNAALLKSPVMQGEGR